jgi:hypothetical protein
VATSCTSGEAGGSSLQPDESHRTAEHAPAKVCKTSQPPGSFLVDPKDQLRDRRDHHQGCGLLSGRRKPDQPGRHLPRETGFVDPGALVIVDRQEGVGPSEHRQVGPTIVAAPRGGAVPRERLGREGRRAPTPQLAWGDTGEGEIEGRSAIPKDPDFDGAAFGTRSIEYMMEAAPPIGPGQAFLSDLAAGQPAHVDRRALEIRRAVPFATRTGAPRLVFTRRDLQAPAGRRRRAGDRRDHRAIAGGQGGGRAHHRGTRAAPPPRPDLGRRSLGSARRPG